MQTIRQAAMAECTRFDVVGESACHAECPHLVAGKCRAIADRLCPVLRCEDEEWMPPLPDVREDARMADFAAADWWADRTRGPQ